MAEVTRLRVPSVVRTARVLDTPPPSEEVGAPSGEPPPSAAALSTAWAAARIAATFLFQVVGREGLGPQRQDK